MSISSQDSGFVIPERGPRARTARLILETAVALMQLGRIPTISEVAEQAGVSRATAYRYFPTQTSLVHAVVGSALGPRVDLSMATDDPEARIEKLITTAMPRLFRSQTVFRAALKLSLEQSLAQKDDDNPAEPTFKRGNRVELLRDALSPLAATLSPDKLDRLTKALSLIFGIEALIIMTDIWNADEQEAGEVALWAAKALVRSVLNESSVLKESGDT
ncbi:MAG: TetR/AcrR family transcriptional regulator [Mesorhizobium sp.]